jgi:uncharacterized protein YbjT (DUF2867 family)
VMFGSDDAFLTTLLKFLSQLPIYPMFGRGLTKLQPAYVEDVAQAIVKSLQRTDMNATTFELGGPHTYAYEELLRAVAYEAGLKPRLIQSHLQLGMRWLGLRKYFRGRPYPESS